MLCVRPYRLLFLIALCAAGMLRAQAVPLIEGDLFTVADLPPGHEWHQTTFVILQGETRPFLNRAARYAFGVDEKKIRRIDAELFYQVVNIYPLGDFITQDEPAEAVARAPQSLENIWLKAPAGFNIYFEFNVKALAEDEELSQAIGAEELLQDVLLLDVEEENIESLFVAAVQENEELQNAFLFYTFSGLDQDVATILRADGWTQTADASIFIAGDSTLLAQVPKPDACLVGDPASFEMWHNSVVNEQSLYNQEKMRAVCAILDENDDPIKGIYCFQAGTVASQGSAIEIGSALTDLAGVGGLGDLFKMFGPVLGAGVSYRRFDSYQTLMSAYGIMESARGAKNMAGLIGLAKGMGKLAASLDPGSPESQHMLEHTDRMNYDVVENVAVTHLKIRFDEMQK